MLNKAVLFLSFCFAFAMSFAQTSSISPYSRFGIGELHRIGTEYNYSMGGLSAPLADRYTVNPENPASYAHTFKTTFQTGIRTQRMELNNGDKSQEIGFSNLNHVLINMKMADAPWGFVVGMTPYTSTGYEVSVNRVEELEGNSADIIDSYAGDGGISKGFIGFGKKFNTIDYRYFKDALGTVTDSIRFEKHAVSLGANVAYFFGGIEESRRIDFEDVDFLDTRITATTKMHSFGVDLGIHYSGILKQEYNSKKELLKRWVLQAGVTYTPDMDWTTSYKELNETVQQFSGVDLPVDTAQIINGIGFTNIPSRLTGGVSIHHEGESRWKWMVGVDFKTQDWSRSTKIIDGLTTDLNLAASNQMSFGLQLSPKDLSEGENLFQRSSYQLGMRVEDSYLSLRNTQIRDEAFTAGISIPLVASKSASQIHFGMEIGTRGTTDEQLIEENYLNIYVGVSLSPWYRNIWFRERKYD